VTHYLIGIGQAAGGGSSGLMQMAPLVLIFVVFYVLVIRPQSKKAKELQGMLKELKKGDDIVILEGEPRHYLFKEILEGRSTLKDYFEGNAELPAANTLFSTFITIRSVLCSIKGFAAVMLTAFRL